MEDDTITKKCSSVVIESQEVNNTESVENFQKFIFELFENNGVINDLRAYLRGHIVEVLRCAQTGQSPTCQKHFTQRLELPFQALNILILEYLLRMEFNYSLSVFISEIPLANMVFGYAKSMMQTVDRDSTLKFVNEDIWSILNYLGLKCDSDHAMNVVEMYNRDKNSPLLLCILQCMPMYKEFKEPIEVQHGSSQESIVSNDKNINPERPRTAQECKHYSHCRSCQDKVDRIRDRYRKKKKDLVENMKEFNISAQNVDTLLKNIDLTERNIIDEMFGQVKSVYEAEVDMMKTDEETRLKRSLAAYAAQLQNKKDEMEQEYKSRTEQLERNVEKKKRFLWELARSLRDQHNNITMAMNHVREETDRLAAKEDNLKSQMAEAEQILRQRGEDMRTQITNELLILEGHLESMKKERELINKEKSELEHIKSLHKNNEHEELRNHYDLLKNEFQLLKKYLENTKIEAKCVEKGTVTDLDNYNTVLNNGHDLDRRTDERVKPKQLVNDLKKQKNVNFSQSNIDEYKNRSPTRSRSSASSEAGDASNVAGQPGDEACDVTSLYDDNNRLRLFVAQQREQIEELTATQARLQAELIVRPIERPRTAPPQMSQQNVFPTASTSNQSNGWKKGAGEELSFLSSAQPRIVLPGDDIPFIGVVRNRHDYRKYMINQWRTLRQRISPVSITKRPPVQHFIERHVTRNPSAGFRINEEDQNSSENRNQEVTLNLPREQYQKHPNTTATEVRTREKSPKSVLREAKEKLKTNIQITKEQPQIPRDKSPTTVLKEAKLRLKKLEIEAEAVEKSYLDFRKKREALKTEQNLGKNHGVKIVEETDTNRNRSSYALDENAIESTSKNFKPTRYTAKYFEPYIQQYCANYDIGPTHFKNKNATYYHVTPIPNVYSDPPKEKLNLLETPMTEFRKHYTSEKRLHEDSKDRSVPLNDSRKYSESPQNSHSISRPLTPILKKTSGSSSRARSPVHITIEHSPIKRVNSPDSSNLAKTLIIKSIKDDSFLINGDSRDKSPARSIVLSIKEHSVIKADSESVSRPKSAQMNVDEHSLSKNIRTLETSSRSRTPSLKDNSLIDNLQSSSGNSEQSNNFVGSARKEVIRQAKHDKVKELQILEHNIKKIYNLPEQSNLSSASSDGLKLQESNRKSYDLNYEDSAIVKNENMSEIKQETDKNLLRVEVESVCNDLKNSESLNPQDLFIVESAINGENQHVASDIESEKKLSPKMTIIVSPIRSAREIEDHSGEKEQKMSEHLLNQIYQGPPINENKSSVQMQLELSQAIDDTITELEQHEDPDYPDDFSADVDNYNSHSEDGNRSQSPTSISMAKTSEDENFWDS